MVSSIQNSDDSNPNHIVAKNFWYTVVQKDDHDDVIVLIPSKSRSSTTHPSSSSSSSPDIYRHQNYLPRLPVVPQLDPNGRLPRGSYFICPKKHHVDDTKETCRIQIAWNLWNQQQENHPTPYTTMANTQDIPQQSEIHEMVQTMQQFVDAGFTSFQCKDHQYHRTLVESHLYRSFWQQSPGTIRQQCRLTVPLCIRSDILRTFDPDDRQHRPSGDIFYTDRMRQLRLRVRNAVVTSLERIQCDCIDDLQIQCTELGLLQHQHHHHHQIQQQVEPQLDRTNMHNYCLDVVDILQDLQREGLVRDISARHLSDALYFSMQRAGLADVISIQQRNANLVSPSSCIQSSSSSTFWRPTPDLWTAAENPLAGGWLTDRHVQHSTDLRKDQQQQPWESYQQQLSVREREQWKIILNWAQRMHPDLQQRQNNTDSASLQDVWQIYRKELMDPLVEMSRKYDVSIASVVLRWTLQQGEQKQSSVLRDSMVSAVVVGCRLGPEQFHGGWSARHPPTHPTQRIQQLRQVMQFRLEDDDMELLNQLAAVKQIPPPATATTKNDMFMDDDALLKRLDKGELVETAHGLLIPGASSAWLLDA